MRPGRLDRLVYVPLPDENTRDEIFRLRLASVPLAEDVKFSELVKLSHGYSGAEVCFCCISIYLYFIIELSKSN